MAKGQKRSNKQARKLKSVEKKPSGPKYLRTEGLQATKLTEQRARPRTANK